MGQEDLEDWVNCIALNDGQWRTAYTWLRDAIDTHNHHLEAFEAALSAVEDLGSDETS